MGLGWLFESILYVQEQIIYLLDGPTVLFLL